jgi:hypothetical protein
MAEGWMIMVLYWLMADGWLMLNVMQPSKGDTQWGHDG